MSITRYIPAEALKSEGFIHCEDKEGLINALLEQSPELAGIELPVVQVAAYLGVRHGRVYWYLKHKGLPQRLTVGQMLKMDWSEVIDKDRKGDNKRKRTYIKF